MKKSNQNNKKIMLYLFLSAISIWFIILFFIYLNSKRDVKSDYQFLTDYSLPKKEKDIMKAPLKIYEIETEKFAPVNYTYRISMREKISLIDKDANEIASVIDNSLLSYNIIDEDLKSEEKLNEKIMFQFEPKLDEEYYPGMKEESETKERKNLTIKESFGIIKTNL